MLVSSEQITKVWSTHTVDSHSALETRTLRTQAAAWINPEAIPLHEISQSPKDKYLMIPVGYLEESASQRQRIKSCMGRLGGSVGEA